MMSTQVSPLFTPITETQAAVFGMTEQRSYRKVRLMIHLTTNMKNEIDLHK